MFQNLRQGNTLYVIDKSGVPALKLGQVLATGNPTPVYSTQTAGLTLGMQPKMEVLVRAKVDDKEGEFPHLPADQNVHDYGTMVVTDSREAALSEVDAIKQNAKAVLDSVAHNEATVAACDEMFKVLNPSYAKEKERDEAISSLSERLDNFEKRMGQTLGNIEKLLSKNAKS